MKSANFTLDDRYATQLVYCGHENPKYQQHSAMIY